MYQLLLHKTLTPEKWNRFPLYQQILMIANEVNRLRNGVHNGQDIGNLKECIERTLELCDLAISSVKGNLQKELLRFRELFGELYLLDVDKIKNAEKNIDAFYKVLMLSNPQTAEINW